MKDISVLIVDDSPFSVAVISNMLEEKGFHVAGSANTLEEAVESAKNLKPDIVTMDMTMPGTNGLECTKAIHEIDPNIKIIIVSSMMDDEIIMKAKRVQVSGYVQKPVDPEELSLIINRTMADDELFQELKDIYYKYFREAITDTFNKLVKSVPVFEQESLSNREQESRGISVLMGITGKYAGRLILDMSHDTLMKLATVVMKTPPANGEILANILGEFTNIAAGNACSMINRKNKLFGLRVSPPTIVHGESLKISKTDIDSITSSIAKTKYGEIYMNVGFTRGAGEWLSNI